VTEQVGPYSVLRTIGTGGSARADLAVLRRAYGFERHVVLKRPLDHLRGDPQTARMLQREAALGGRLVHPNLIAMLDAGTHAGYDYVVLEHVNGLSLRELMREADGALRAIDRAAVLSIVTDAARGLHEAHELTATDGSPLGLVHRDVTPANVLLGHDGTVKVADFGLAKDTRVETLSGAMRGTVTYMAPERCRGHAFDRRADVFALGVILHELLTRRRLFAAESDVASLHRVVSGEVPDPRSIDPSIPAELAELTLHALAHDPMQRLASAGELADRLEDHAARARIVTGRRVIAAAIAACEETDPAAARIHVAVLEPAAAPIVPSRSRRRFVIAPLVAGLVGGSAAAGWYFTHRAPAPTPAAAEPPPVVVAPEAEPAPRPQPEPEPEPEPELTPEPKPTPEPEPEPARAPVAQGTPATAPPTRRTRHRATKKQPKAPAATPTTPAKVEWNRTLLLPSDSTKHK
jgi:serine/threonine-protein kinase